MLAAHVDSRLTGIGPLARLRDVAVGATLTVTTADGQEHAYRVVDVEKVPRSGRRWTGGSTGRALRGSCS